MPHYRFLFRCDPPGFFGLPDGDKIVIPADGLGTDLRGPILDTRTGKLVSHGTLSQFRQPDQALSALLKRISMSLNFTDNFLEVLAEGEEAQATTNNVLAYVDLLLQSLTSMYGSRFSASLLLVEDESGTQQSVHVGPRTVRLFQAVLFNIDELKGRVATAATWAEIADPPAKKALFYFEHACLINEFSETLHATSTHAAFSRALAFLQLWKALTSLLGEPGTDRDYQRRFKAIGLPNDFWENRVRPLYDIRNDEDVAHYSHSFPEAGAFVAKYSHATAVFRDALEAHMSFIAGNKTG